jgi:hypothetical protein
MNVVQKPMNRQTTDAHKWTCYVSNKNPNVEDRNPQQFFNLQNSNDLNKGNKNR